MNLLQKMGRIYERFLDVLMLTACVIFTFAMLLVCVDVILRYVFNSPIIWAMEVCEIILVGIVCLGMAWLMKEDGHVRLDFLLYRLGPKHRAIVKALTSILAAVTLAFILRYGVKEIGSLMECAQAVETGILRIPKVSLLIPLAAGLFLFFIEFIRQAINQFLLFRDLRRSSSDGRNPGSQ